MAKDTREYSVRMLENARKNSHERPDPNPVFMPVGRIKPETFNQALERIMSHSAAMGMTLQEAYDSVRGEFDFDDDPDTDDYLYENYHDDEFEQSSFASYEDAVQARVIDTPPISDKSSDLLQRNAVEAQGEARVQLQAHSEPVPTESANDKIEAPSSK